MTEVPPAQGGKVHVRRAFITGFVALFPLFLTALVLGLLWQVVSRVSEPLGGLVTWIVQKSGGYSKVPDWTGTAAALILTALIIYLMGVMIASIFGRRLLVWFENTVAKVPVVGYVYPHAKTLSDFLFGAGKVRFDRVVAIEYPRRGLFSLGFVTSGGIEALSRARGQRVVAVFVPTSPTPLTGWTVLVEEAEILDVDMSVDEAVRFVVSCGVLVPDDFPRALGRSQDVPNPSSSSGPSLSQEKAG